MYRKILVALENSRADESLLPHVTELAKQLGSELLLVHVADGWVACNFDRLKLAESDEMKADRAYLDEVVANLRAQGMTVAARLALGDPPGEILKMAEAEQCTLIAMTSHGHPSSATSFTGAPSTKCGTRARFPFCWCARRKSNHFQADDVAYNSFLNNA